MTIIPITTAVDDAFRRARYMHFEQGMDNEFRRDLIALIEEHGEDTIEDIRVQIFAGSTDGESLHEALKLLGEIEHPETYDARRHLLVNALWHSNLWARDGAGLGLDFMEDLATLPALRAAVEREQTPSLREDLQAIVESLGETNERHNQYDFRHDTRTCQTSG